MRFCRLTQLVDVAPIHAQIQQRARVADRLHLTDRLRQERLELGRRHLATGHGEFGVLNRALSLHVTRNFYVIGRVGTHRRRGRARH